MQAFWSSPSTVGASDWAGVYRRSLILSAQAYAGTTSTLRIVRQLAAAGGYKVVTHHDDMWIAGTPEKADEFVDYKEFNEIYYWRRLNVCLESLRKASVSPDSFRFVVTFRDPRDVFVSEFNNAAYDHPLPPEPEHQKTFLAWREGVKRMGMDAFALSRIEPFRAEFFAPLLELTRRVPQRTVVPLSYARLCLDLPGFLERLTRQLDFTPSAALFDHLLQTEDVQRPERMVYSNCHFPRASPLPGRFRRELKPETIARLNEGLADVLAWMRAVDDPAFADTYLP